MLGYIVGIIIINSANTACEETPLDSYPNVLYYLTEEVSKISSS
jgi:hypothetical protein